MTCRELVGFLSDYLAGELAPEARRIFEAHLAGCPECATYLRSYTDTIRLARACAGDDVAVPAGVPERLRAAIEAARRGG